VGLADANNVERFTILRVILAQLGAMLIFSVSFQFSYMYCRSKYDEEGRKTDTRILVCCWRTILIKRLKREVEAQGIDPRTSRMLSERSTI
jgi:hypothetical protein